MTQCEIAEKLDAIADQADESEESTTGECIRVLATVLRGPARDLEFLAQVLEGFCFIAATPGAVEALTEH